MKGIFVTLAVAALASAQNITLIPSGISNDCNTFLVSLNNDTTLANCVQPLLNATASFNPMSNSNISQSDINWALAHMCKTNAGCSDSIIRTWLSRFYASCSAELTSSTTYNSQIRELYDILYVVNPLKGAVCSVDSANQAYCVNQVTGVGKNSTGPSGNVTTPGAANATTSGNTTVSVNSTVNGTNGTNGTVNGTSNTVLISSFASTSGFSPVQFAADHLYVAINGASALSKRMIELLARQSSSSDNSQSAFATVITPNTTTYRNTNLPFLFLQPTMNSAALCTPCTREIMVQYIKWETAVPYALGLTQSPILGGQVELWNAITQICGSAFVNAINSQVGQFSGVSNSTSAASPVYVAGAGSVGTAMVGVAVVAGAMALFA